MAGAEQGDGGVWPSRAELRPGAHIAAGLPEPLELGHGEVVDEGVLGPDRHRQAVEGDWKFDEINMVISASLDLVRADRARGPDDGYLAVGEQAHAAGGSRHRYLQGNRAAR